MKKIILPIVKRKRKLGYKIAVLSFLFLFIGFVISIIFFDNYIFSNVLISLSFLAALASVYIKEYDQKGKLILLEDRIITYTDSCNKEFILTALDNLNITLDGFKGERYFSTLVLFPKNGLNNYFKFNTTNGKVYLFEFLLLKEQIHDLKNIIKKWKQKGIDLKVND